MRCLLITLVMSVWIVGCDQTSFPVTGKHESTDVPEYLSAPLQGRVSQHGLFRMVRSAGISDDPATSTGKVISRPVVQKIETTERIPLIRGAQMYLQYRIWPLPDQPHYASLRRVLRHPPMTLPDGSVSTGSDFSIKRTVSSNHVIAYTGYGFDEDYELVEGDWVFEIWLGDHKLVEQTFTTYRPDEAEVARLKPLLDMGNSVNTRMASPHNPDPSRNWPRVIVDGSGSGAPAGVSEAMLDMRKPIMQP